METVAEVAPVLGLVLLLIESARCFLQHPPQRSVGALGLAAGALLALFLIETDSGAWVLAAELGIVMVKGAGAILLLRLAVVAIAVTAPIWWYRVHADRSFARWTLALGLLVGLWAASRVAPFNPGDPEALVVDRYGTWWPPLATWLAVCLAGSLLDLAGSGVSRAVRAAVVCALVACLADYALAFQDLPDPQSRPLWGLLERGGAAAALLLLGGSLAAARVRAGGRRRQAIVFLALLGGLALARALAAGPPGWLAAEDVGLLAVCIAAVRPARALAHGPARASAHHPARASAHHPALAGAHHPALAGARLAPRTRAVLAAALPVLALLLADLVSIGLLDRRIEILLLVLVWLVLAGALAGAPALAPWRKLASDRIHLRRQRRQAKQEQEGRAGSRVAEVIKAVLIPIVAFVGLVAVSEALDYRPLVIQSFEWIGAKDDKDEVAKDLTDGLVNALGSMREELRTDLVRAIRLTSGEHPSATGLRALQAGAEAHTVEIATSKAGDLKIANMDIPLGAFVTPIQRIVRSLMGVRVVTGTVSRAPDGGYRVRASASDGQTWSGNAGATPVPAGGPGTGDDLAPALACGSEALSEGDAAPAAASPTQPLPPATSPATSPARPAAPSAAPAAASAAPAAALPAAPRDGSHDAIQQLVERLAFDIASSDPSFLGGGMTKDWQAFRYFRLGLRQWRAFEARQDRVALAHAVRFFRAAMGCDHGFTMASYRLGIAMRAQGRPAAALAAFRAGGEGGARFVPAALEEAATLYDFNDHYRLPAVLGQWPPDWTKRRQALRRWAQLIALPPSDISVSERRSALLGICRYEVDRFQESEDAIDRNYLAYYFCNRSLALFWQLDAAERKGQDERNAQAASLDTMGLALDSHAEVLKTLPGEGRQWPYWRADERGQAWSCSPGAIDGDEMDALGSVASLKLEGSRRSRAALGYYRQSLALAPDDPIVQCNAASAVAYLREDAQPMAFLRNDSATHLSLGLDLWKNGVDRAHAEQPDGRPSARDQERAFGYYLRALWEYRAAVDLDSTSYDALTDFGLVYWQMRLDYATGRVPVSMDAGTGTVAESFARTAITVARLAQRRQDEYDAVATLGEVLMAEGRFAEAVTQLEAAMAMAADQLPFWEYRNETRWDLAQARVCAATAADAVGAVGEREALLAQATKELEAIRQSDRRAAESGERARFAMDQEQLDAQTLRQHCGRLSERWISQGMGRLPIRQPAPAATSGGAGSAPAPPGAGRQVPAAGDGG